MSGNKETPEDLTPAEDRPVPVPSASICRMVVFNLATKTGVVPCPAVVRARNGSTLDVTVFTPTGGVVGVDGATQGSGEGEWDWPTRV